MERRITIDTSKYEGHQPAPWRWVKPTEVWFLYAEQGNRSNLNHQGVGGIWLPDTFCRLGKGLDPTHRDEKSTYDLIADAPLILEAYKELKETLQTIYLDLYLDANGYTSNPNLYSDILDCIKVKTGEPDDLSGEIGSLINEYLSLDVSDFE